MFTKRSTHAIFQKAHAKYHTNSPFQRYVKTLSICTRVTLAIYHSKISWVYTCHWYLLLGFSLISSGPWLEIRVFNNNLFLKYSTDFVFSFSKHCKNLNFFFLTSNKIWSQCCCSWMGTDCINCLRQHISKPKESQKFT